ncbi:maleylpyruvate isomerase N-terminal domain-containing protein [Cellulomonas fimi]|uniref:Mycothiol-dependent maleylpyruvate isomerase n=1 Tax=Cellulomonas fimi (strain ATCC 484 / DSM 20113 / JCM 1341 / CCUG 24087 / LMG 16345 / NBRC 15513 / NCIMB 8980 / NCTC 7547 / NRS-133) TaxID=590998 RepID=F4GYJ6_CELFA|nr:maleylpyruvate isomerase N-terminal domain-containing protein [Cellulomonas fimi]AEE47113.1 mycothiol-dependent maleylpyruvate isomerase [Cellulomonas fimi ATCC 484]NNH05605.1 maleylpyruvate isomerase [Cellulomonas fimi]
MPARTDRTDDPTIRADLLLARRAQAYYARQLRGVPDAALDEASAVPGWTRRRLVAHVALDARSMTRRTEWAVAGHYEPLWSSSAERDEVESFTATLPPQALRNLAQHAAIHLDVEWRDLPADAWEIAFNDLDGARTSFRASVPARAQLLWRAALALGHGGRIDDVPAQYRAVAAG